MKKVLGIMLFMVMFFSFIGCGVQTTTSTTNALGSRVTLELYDAEGTKVATESVDFDENDTLLSLVLSTFGAVCQGENGENDSTCSYSGPYGTYVLGIGTVVANPASEYLAFYINGEYAMTGIDATALVNGNVYAFKLETF
jgi:hypothetical protein